MPVSPRRVPVGTTIARLDSADVGQMVSLVARNRGTVAVYVGGRMVSTTTGFQLDPGETITLDLRPTDGGLYAITASGSAECHVLQVGAR
ncbi:hypothetical protein [Micromonospora echinospora]|uniref:hypothetical protein n=1 Tax=Micromonospora echinospora TaxID=1877 RepID=UPI003A86293E